LNPLRRALGVGLISLAILTAACSSTDPTIRGIVIDVQGDLIVIDQFTVLTPDGDRLELVPAPDVRFHDGAPLSHLSEHLRSGDPIEVVYRELDDGTLTAMRVEDVSDN
jgi:hypothetical protein